MELEIQPRKTEEEVFLQLIYPFLVRRNEPVALSQISEFLLGQRCMVNQLELRSLLNLFADFVDVTDSSKLDCEAVEAITRIKFCKNFNGKKVCPFGRCDKLHICRHFVKGKCNFGKKCNKPHTFSDPNTQRILSLHGLLNLSEEALRVFLCRHVQYALDESEYELPKQLLICHYYNVLPGCMRGHKCPYLHICRFYAREGSCKFSKQCMRSHSLGCHHSKMLLKRYNFDEQTALRHFQKEYFTKLQMNGKTSPRHSPPLEAPISQRIQMSSGGTFSPSPKGHPRPVEHSNVLRNEENLLASSNLPVEPCLPCLLPEIEQWNPWYHFADDASKDLQIWQTRDSHCNDQAGKYSYCWPDLKTGSKYIKPSSTSEIADKEEICGLHLEVPSFDHICGKIHTSEPFCWQVAALDVSVKEQWRVLSMRSNLQLEEQFCDVNSNVGVVMENGEELMVNFEEKLAGRGQICHSTALKFVGQRVVQGVTVFVLFRRISTKSNAVEPPSKYDTVWKWYYQSEGRQWTSYDSSKTQDQSLFSTTKISSALIEKNMKENVGQLLAFMEESSFIMTRQMTELNWKTKMQRKLRRRPMFRPMKFRRHSENSEEQRSPSRNSWPDLRDWAVQPEASHKATSFRLIELPTASQWYSIIENEFSQVLPCTILKVESVQHMNLLSAYKSKKIEVTERLHQEPREKFLYHFLDEEETVLRDIEDEKFCFKPDLTFLAIDAAKAHKRSKKTGNEFYKMIIFRVIIPPPGKGPGTTHFFPRRPSADGSSIEALFRNYGDELPLYAISSTDYIYPEFIVTYSFEL